MSSSPPGPPDANIGAAALGFYGTTMLCVQTFELALGTLVMVTKLHGRAGSTASMERKLRRLGRTFSTYSTRRPPERCATCSPARSTTTCSPRSAK